MSTCKNCNKTIQRKNGKFCNRSCSVSYNNRQRRRETANCTVCGRSTGRQSKKYCSRECANIDRRQQTIFRNLRLMETNSPVGPGSVRKVVLYIYDYACSICGISQWQEKPIVLFVDHIDGNPYNNKLENLRLICPNCDTQTDTFMARNRGNGRKERCIRYQKDKLELERSVRFR